ncbi:hypothetical protein [Bradyrhizobium sp. CCBAU 53338]|nr:hypothetical protein [Bradyrhizobium sp. CCBAU 53338]
MLDPIVTAMVAWISEAKTTKMATPGSPTRSWLPQSLSSSAAAAKVGKL